MASLLRRMYVYARLILSVWLTWEKIGVEVAKGSYEGSDLNTPHPV